jgi:hypothetical protein
VVSKIVHDTSGTRTLVLLNAGAKGRVLTLGLARTLHPLFDADASDTPIAMCEIDLGPPPWERLEP